MQTGRRRVTGRTGSTMRKWLLTENVQVHIYTMKIPFRLTSQQSAFLALSRHFLSARAANVSIALIRIGGQQYPNRV